MAELVALLAIIILVIILAWYFWPSTPVVGTIPGGVAITQILDAWASPPTSIKVGEDATFILHVQNSNPLASPQITNVSGRHYVFSVGPTANVSIVSVTPAASAPSSGSTNANGQITVVVRASSVPATGGGSLVGIPAADTSVQIVTNFEIKP